MLLLLACSNRAAKQRKAFKGGNFHELRECAIQLFLSLLGFRLHVTCLKMSLLQFRFSCQSGPDPLPKKKIKLHEEEEEKKKKKEIRMLYNKKQISVLTGQFLKCMAESIWLAYL